MNGVDISMLVGLDEIEDGMLSYLPQPETNSDVELSAQVACDERVFSDNTGYSNKNKWDRIKSVFGANEEATLFSRLSYKDIYKRDDPIQAEAACFLTDLRAQYVSKLIDVKFTHERHLLYLINRQWYVRFRERVRLEGIMQFTKSVILH